jgi:hypothetical protein
VDNWFPILLEFKLFDGSVLPSYKRIQHEGLKILNNHGIPIRYCFNATKELGALSDEQFLDSLLTCLAEPLPSRKPSLEHETLLELISDEPPDDYKLAPLAFCDHRLFGRAQVGALNTARLLILTDQNVASLSPNQGGEIVARLWEISTNGVAKPKKDWLQLDMEIIRLRGQVADIALEYKAVLANARLAAPENDDEKGPGPSMPF